MKLLFAIPVVVGMCGTSASPTGVDAHLGADASGTGSGSGACMLTLSGAVSATTSCTVAAGWTSSSNQGGFGIAVNGTQMINVGINWPGEPTAMHYAQSAVMGGVSVTMGTQAWVASTANGSNPAIGSFDLTLTSVGNPITTSSGKAYTVHGSLAATLLPEGGATGNVTLIAQF